MGIVRHLRGDFRWEGVERQSYGVSGLEGVTKQVVIGSDEGAGNFAVRYFELAPGARSSLDLHDHDHGVVVMRGRGVVRLGGATHEIGFGDAVYVAPREVHQFENTGDEPLGFLCVVPPRSPSAKS
jgi:quercetin dioxygenase-like cupin family protein